MILKRKKSRKVAFEGDDSNGLHRAVLDFNEYNGPARIFYNRNSHTFETKCYPPGSEKYFGELANGLDRVELYRKTTPFGNVKVVPEELLLMERDLEPYAIW
ncbi:MAG: hypothetical protein E7Z63_00875 [Thermoplasmata archaeon]|nr:hypothetical protein [Thermoplasmata archaeon]